MTAKRIFRYLIATTWLVPLAANLLEFKYSPLKSAVAINPTTGFVPHPFSGMQVFLITFTLSVFIVSFVGSIGLWFFQNWARIIYLPFGVFYVYWWPYGMPPPRLPIALASLATFVTFGAQGAAAAMSFLPPLSVLFKHACNVSSDNVSRDWESGSKS